MPGIDYAAFVYLRWNDRIALAVFVDQDRGSQSNSIRYTSPGDGKARFECQFADVAGNPSVELRWATPDGVSEPLTISGKTFDVSQGSVFLVSRATGKVEVKQLKRDNIKVRPDIEGGPEKDLLQLKTDPDLIAFYTKKA